MALKSPENTVILSKQKINTLPYKLDFEWIWKGRLLKALWEKKKMLVTSIFFFSHNVFYPSQKKKFSCWVIFSFLSANLNWPKIAVW